MSYDDFIDARNAAGKARYMSTWTQEEVEYVEELREEGLTFKEIADVMAEEGFQARNFEAIKKFMQRRRATTKNFEKAVIQPGIEAKYKKALKETVELRDHYMKIVTEKFIKVGRPVNATKKILTISDLHGPWLNRFVIDHAIKNHSDADILVINGDLFDCFAISKWPKSKAVLLRWEYEIVVELMKMFVDIFPKIVLVSGNHENRLQSMFSSKIDPAVSFLTAPDLLKRLAQGYDFTGDDEFEPVHDWGGKVIYDSGSLKWYTKIGQCIFVHPSKGYSTVPLTNVRKAANYFKSREEFEAICMSHTHQQGHCIHEGKLLFDQGCACVPLEYEAKGDMQFGGQSFGYGLVYMDNNGHVDFQKSGPVYLGTGTPIKTDDPLELL